ncbi:MAG: hypothetical protein V4490_00605 [Pseudomonadota bacterium]
MHSPDRLLALNGALGILLFLLSGISDAACRLYDFELLIFKQPGATQAPDAKGYPLSFPTVALLDTYLAKQPAFVPNTEAVFPSLSFAFKKHGGGILLKKRWTYPICPQEPMRVRLQNEDYPKAPYTAQVIDIIESAPNDALFPKRVWFEKEALYTPTLVFVEASGTRLLDIQLDIWHQDTAEHRTRLYATRKIKAKDPQYFDHPYLGALLVATPHDTELPEP